MKLLMSQDGISDSALCITTLSTMTNLFQGNQSVLFSDMKGDLSKTRVTEMPPTATRSKLEKTKQNSLFLFYHYNTRTFSASQTKNFILLIKVLNLPCKIIPVYLPDVTTVFMKELHISTVPFCMHQWQGTVFHCSSVSLPSTYQLELIITSHL